MELLVRKILVSIIIRQKRFVKKEFFPICRNFLNCCRSRTFFAQKRKRIQYFLNVWGNWNSSVFLYGWCFPWTGYAAKRGANSYSSFRPICHLSRPISGALCLYAFCHGNLRSRKPNLLKFSNAHGILPEIERLAASGPGHKPPWKVRINRFHALPIWLALARRSFCLALFHLLWRLSFF